MQCRPEIKAVHTSSDRASPRRRRGVPLDVNKIHITRRRPLALFPVLLVGAPIAVIVLHPPGPGPRRHPPHVHERPQSPRAPPQDPPLRVRHVSKILVT